MLEVLASLREAVLEMQMTVLPVVVLVVQEPKVVVNDVNVYCKRKQTSSVLGKVFINY